MAPPRRLTFVGNNDRPIWSPDGKSVMFTSDREGDSGLFRQKADGSGSAERIAKIDGAINLQPEVVTLDESLLASQKPRPLSGGNAASPALSSDGRWLAHYRCTGIYVEPFPSNGSIYQISTNGETPVWSPDGKQLFYLDGTGRTRQIVSVDIQTQPNFKLGNTARLPIEGIFRGGPRPYDISPDGKYFVVMLPSGQADSANASADQINITLNWFEELKQRVPVH